MLFLACKFFLLMHTFFSFVYSSTRALMIVLASHTRTSNGKIQLKFKFTMQRPEIGAFVADENFFFYSRCRSRHDATKKKLQLYLVTGIERFERDKRVRRRTRNGKSETC
jgi:hypothetical protein